MRQRLLGLGLLALLVTGCQTAPTTSPPPQGAGPSPALDQVPTASTSPGPKEALAVEDLSFLDRSATKTKVATIHPGQTIYSRVVFKGLSLDSKGQVRAQAHIKLTAPDGTVAFDQPLGAPLVQAYPAGSDPKIVLFPYVGIDPGDPLGEYKLSLSLKDLVANTEAGQEKSFTAAGNTKSDEETLTITDMRYATSPQGPVMVDAVFAPGSRVYLLYKLKGFQTRPDGTAWLQQDLKVTYPDGKVKSAGKVLDHKGKVPIGDLVMNNYVTIAGNSRDGTCKVDMVLRDMLSGQTLRGTYLFTVRRKQP